MTKAPLYEPKYFQTLKEKEIGLNISIIGSGIVGQATGIGFSRKGVNTLFHDIDKNKLLALQTRGYENTDNIDDVMYSSNIIFVCVPTPTINNNIDLSIIEKCTEEIGRSLGKFKKHPLIVFRSTMPPQTTRTKLIPILEKYSKMRAGMDFGVCTNPEFLREQSPLDDFLESNRIVIGAYDRKSGDLLENLYGLLNSQIIRTNLDTAEMIKYVSNLYLASKISFFNEIFLICENLGLNAKTVSEAVSMDSRISNYGIYGGKPFGGMCLPKDLSAFVSYLETRGFNPKLLKAVAEINNDIELYDKKKGLNGKE